MSWLLIQIIRGYQYFFSPWLGSNCRFSPTCSAYAIECIKQWGTIKGIWLATKRIGRCHPWCEGGEDLPPKNPNRHL